MTDLPEPLTPPECDLQDFPFMPLHVARLRDSDMAATVSSEALWHAALLWSASWHELPAASVPNDDHVLMRLCKFEGSVRRWRRIRPQVLHGFLLCDDGRFYHPLIAKLALNAWAKKLIMRRRLDRRIEIMSDEWAAIRSAIFLRDNFTCQYCGARGVRLECDHVVPVATGGPTAPENLVTACFTCNRSKGAKSIKEWMR